MMSNDTRVNVTRKMLKEGLLRLLSVKPISKISISELCRESGINRATFYNHYDSPERILRDMAEDYHARLMDIYTSRKRSGSTEDQAILECLEFLYEQKRDIKVLFSKNAEDRMGSFAFDILKKGLSEEKTGGAAYEDSLLYAVITASAAFGLIQIWLTNDVDKTPREILDILKRAVRENRLL